VLRLIGLIAIALALTWCGATVKIGNRTFFGHVRAIWHTEEMQDLKEGVKDTAGPAVKRVGRGIEAGYKAIKDGDAGAGSAAPTPPPPAP